jgi:hypothetical protein
VIISDGEDNIIDSVGWGKSDKAPPALAVEGDGIVLEKGLETGQSIERKTPGWDTDDNSLDFVLREVPNPQNSQYIP